MPKNFSIRDPKTNKKGTRVIGTEGKGKKGGRGRIGKQ